MTLPVFSHPAGNLDDAVARLTTAETAFTALGYAIRNADLRTLREILEADELTHQLLTMADYAGNTAVHLAAVGPDAEVLRELLTRGASVHARNRANNTPLYLAERSGNADCVRLLKEAGAHLWEAEEEQQQQQQRQHRGGSSTPSKRPRLNGANDERELLTTNGPENGATDGHANGAVAPWIGNDVNGLSV